MDKEQVVTKKLIITYKYERGFNMKNKRQRVLVIKNMRPGIFKRTVFVLKKSANEEDSQLIREAEKVVEKYMGNKNSKIMQEKRFFSPMMVMIGAAIVGLGVCIIAIFV